MADADTDVRWAACHALGAIGPKAAKAVPGLTKLVEDAHPDVRTVARAAVQKVQKTAAG